MEESKITSWRNKQLKKVVVLFCVAFLVRTGFYLINANCTGSGDSASRLFISYNLASCMKSASFFPSTAWLPLHFWMIASMLKITSGAVLSALIFHILMGSLCVVSMFFLIKELIPRFAYVTALSVALFPPMVYMSVQTMTEVNYVFFISVALLYRLKYEKTQERNHLLLMSLATVAASLLRYEGWIFTVILLASFLFSESSRTAVKKHKLILLTSLAGCLLITFDQAISGLPPLYGVMESDDFVSWKFSKFGIDYKTIFIDTYPGVFPFMIIGWLYSWFTFRRQSHPYRIYLFIVSVPFLAFMTKILNHSLDPDDRYLIIHSVFFIPFSFLLIEKIWMHFFSKSIRKVALLTPVLFCIVTYPLNHKIMTAGLKQPSELFSAIKFTKSQNLEGNFIVDEINNYADYLYLTHCGISRPNDCDNSRKCILQICNAGNDYYLKTLKAIENDNTDYLVLYKDSKLSKQIKPDKQVFEFANHKLLEIFSDHSIKIFKVVRIR